MKFVLVAAESAGKEAKLCGMELFVENKSYIYNLATDAIEEHTVPGGKYRRGVASAYQISAARGSNVRLIDGGRPKGDSQLSNSIATSMQSFGSAFGDPIQLRIAIEVHKTFISVVVPQVERGAPKRGNSGIIGPNDSAQNTTEPSFLRGRATINERQIAPRKLWFQDRSDRPRK